MNNWTARCVKKDESWHKGDTVVVEDGIVAYCDTKEPTGWINCSDSQEGALKSFETWCKYQSPSEWIEMNEINDSIKSKPKKISAKKAIKLFLETYKDNDKQIKAFGEILGISEIHEKYTPKEIVDILTKYDEERKNEKKKKG